MLSDSDSFVPIDLHVSIPVAGLLTGTLAKTIQIVMTLAAGALAMRFASDRPVLVMASAAAAAGPMMLGATEVEWRSLGRCNAAQRDLRAALGVPVFAMIYRWAEGTRAATDQALLFGASFLAALPTRICATALAGWLGWPIYFAVCVPLYVVAFAILVIAMRRTTPAGRRPLIDVTCIAGAQGEAIWKTSDTRVPTSPAMRTNAEA